MAAQPIVSVVDSDAAARRAWVRMIQEMELPVISFHNEGEFWDECDLFRPGCVLLDSGGPQQTGLELLTRLVEQVCHPPVIMLAEQPNVPLAVRAMRAGAVHFFDKASPQSPIAAAVRAALTADLKRHREQAELHQWRQRWAQLAGGEQAVVELLMQGASNGVVAKELGVSLRGVEVRRAKAMRKMQANSLAELVQMAVRIRIDRGHLRFQ